MTATDQTVTFETICLNIERTMSRHFRHHAEWEDAVQEAKIYAWRDWETNEYTVAHIINRARMRGKAYLNRDKGRRATGHEKASREGFTTAQGDLMREKVQKYIDEYRELHNKKPSIRTVSSAVGISITHASHVMKTMGSARIAALQGTREDWVRTEALVDHTRLDGASEDEAMSASLTRALSVPDFTPDIIAEDSFNRILLKIDNPKYAELLRLRFQEDMMPVEIGQYWGIEKNPGQKVSNMLSRALKHVAKVLNEGA